MKMRALEDGGASSICINAHVDAKNKSWRPKAAGDPTFQMGGSWANDGPDIHRGILNSWDPTSQMGGSWANDGPDAHRGILNPRDPTSQMEGS